MLACNSLFPGISVFFPRCSFPRMISKALCCDWSIDSLKSTDFDDLQELIIKKRNAASKMPNFILLWFNWLQMENLLRIQS